MSRAFAAIAGSLALLFVASCRSPVAGEDETGPADDPSKVGTGVHGWPLYERDVLRHGVRTDVLWPLSSVKSGEDGALTRASFLIPIFLWERDFERRRLGVRPLFDVETDLRSDGPVSDWDVLWPIAKWRTSPTDSKRQIFPLFNIETVETSRGTSTERDLLWPIVVWNNAPEEDRFDVRPIWWSETTARGWYEVAFPVWWRGQEDGERWIHVWPLYGSRSEGTVRERWIAYPFFGMKTDPDENRWEWDAPFPLIHYGRWATGEHTRVLPLYWHSREWGPGSDGAETTLSESMLIAPFWFSQRDTDKSVDVLFPFYGRERTSRLDRQVYAAGLLATTDRVTKPDAADTAASADASGAPAFNDHSLDLLFSIIHERTRPDDSVEARVFPVVWSDTRESDGHFHLWPLYGRSWKGTKTETGTLWPFFTYADYDDGYSLNFPAPLVNFERRGERSESLIFPLWWSRTRKSGAKEGRVAGILADWKYDKDGAGDFHVLWRLIQDEDSNSGRHVFAVNPLFRRETNERGDLHWSALLGLVARTREADDVRWRFLWFLNL